MVSNQQKKKVVKTALFLTSEMELGGGAMFVLNVCEGLRELGGEWRGVAGVFSVLGEVGIQMKQRGLPVIGPFDDALLHEDYMEAMHAECERLKPDAVVANLGGDSYDFLRLVPPGVLRVGIIHADENSVYRLVEAYKPWLDLVVAVSSHAADEFRLRSQPNGLKVTNVACGIPISESVRQASPSKTCRVLYLGRIVEEQKRVRLMARIIRRSVEANPSIEWTIIGDGPEMAETLSSLEDLGNSVSFTGALDYDDVRRRLPEHDLFFLCSDYEGLPLSMLEAMSAGLVPVVSDLNSGISEVVSDGNGIKIGVEDEQGYLDAILDLARSPERLEAFSKRARKDVVEDYSVEAMSRRWEDLLEGEWSGGKAIWKLHDPVTVPPIGSKGWVHHPVLRPVRRIIKKYQKSLKEGLKQ